MRGYIAYAVIATRESVPLHVQAAAAHDMIDVKCELCGAAHVASGGSLEVARRASAGMSEELKIVCHACVAKDAVQNPPDVVQLVMLSTPPDVERALAREQAQRN